ncbi:MAG: hypothetical protein E6Q76_19690 [Rhizobium sp.]|nr:MAG: hypothetical protein E6Q76_19690 [Rhizobium sp.]
MRTVLLLLLLALPLGAAPVPPAPKELPAAALTGRWHYRYGPHLDGRMWLYADHTYVAHHEPGGVIYHGVWWVDGKCLEIRERSFNPATGSEGGVAPYRFDFTRGLGCGTCNGQAAALTHRAPSGD